MSFEDKSPKIQEAIKQASNNPEAFNPNAAPSCGWCGKPVDVNAFKDTLSLKEYNISKMCQGCQDNFFVEE